ncbi:cytochrome bd oxidase small subunit CydS [Radiobacillus deserti]
MESFLIFYAPFIIVGIAIFLSFWIITKDNVINK